MSEPARFAYPACRLVRGSQASLDAALARFNAQPVDEVRLAPGDWRGWPAKRTTLAAKASVAGVGTFRGKERRTITFTPSARPGWWIRRTDQPEQLDTAVDIANLWTSARNLVLRSKPLDIRAQPRAALRLSPQLPAHGRAHRGAPRRARPRQRGA